MAKTVSSLSIRRLHVVLSMCQSVGNYLIGHMLSTALIYQLSLAINADETSLLFAATNNKTCIHKWQTILLFYSS